MADYRLADHTFSRQWRRNKIYSEREIRWLARRRGLEFSSRRQSIQVVDPKTKKVMANFQAVEAPEAKPVDDRTRTLAALKNGA